MPRAWETLCWPKDLGGLGFRLLFDYNRALFSKLGWHLCYHKDKFWVQVIRAKYGSPHMLSIPKHSSSISWWWHGIQKCLPLLEKGLCFAVGEHSVLNCWEDPWVSFLEFFKPKPRSWRLTGSRLGWWLICGVWILLLGRLP